MPSYTETDSWPLAATSMDVSVYHRREPHSAPPIVDPQWDLLADDHCSGSEPCLLPPDAEA
jgi:hypothetical protein